MNTHGPDAVLAELKEQAQRKASLRMFYSAADLLREYRGPFAQETTTERERLAMEYHSMGQAAEEARWGGGGPMPTVAPPTVTTTPAPLRPLPPARPKPPVTKPSTASTAKPPSGAPEYRIEGDKMIFPCRWCKEPATVPVLDAGKYVPCPKCDGLLSVPKLA